MTIFQLLVYSCVSVNGLDGELMTKICRWDSRDLYVTTARCEEAGAKAFMSQIFSFEHIIGESHRHVEKHKCVKVWVND